MCALQKIKVQAEVWTEGLMKKHRGLEEIWVYTYLPWIRLALTKNCILNRSIHSGWLVTCFFLKKVLIIPVEKQGNTK